MILSKRDNIKTYALHEYAIRIKIIREAHRKKIESLSEWCWRRSPMCECRLCCSSFIRSFPETNG